MKATVTIPPDLVEDFGGKEGDILRFGLEDETRLIVHKEGTK